MGLKTLRFWNGRGWDIWEHCFVAAYSKADAIRLINQAAGWRAMTAGELKNYYSECWGRTMDGITPERGVWVTRKKGNVESTPERLI